MIKKDSILIFVLLFIIALLYYRYGAIDSISVKSTVDGKYYSVKDMPDKHVVADILAQIRLNILKLIDYMSSEMNKDDTKKEFIPYIERLRNKINYVIISENVSDHYYTSYSVNKGEQLVFCVRSRKVRDNIHDINLMMYVVLHEISHIACPEFGHTQLFKKIFAFITKSAIDIGIYRYIDFKTNNQEYCGLSITDSIV